MRRMLAAAALAFGALASPAAVAQTPGGAVTADRSAPDFLASPAVTEMRARAQAEGRIRVIVTMNRAAPGGAVSPQAQAAAARALVSAQTALARRIHQDLRDLDAANRFETIPAVVLDVAPPELERLLRDGAVASVQLDRRITLVPRLKQMREITKIESIWPKDRGAKGSGELIAIIDEGLDSDIPEVKGRVVREACSSSDVRCYNPKTGKADAQVSSGRYAAWTCPQSPDKVHSGGGYCNRYSHGGVVSTVAAGAGPGEFSGFGPKLDVFFIRAALEGTTDSSFAKAFDLALAGDVGRRPTAITTSLGFVQYRSAKLCKGVNPALETVFAEARRLGVPVLNSAGNDYGSAIDYPACHPLVIAVGASTEKADGLADFSDTNDMVDLLAPGDKVTFAAGEKPEAGTSFATPSVAATIALLRHAFPVKTPEEILTGLRCTGQWVKQDDPKRPYSSIPRVDAEAAYDFLSKSKIPIRKFLFDKAAEISNWSLGNGPWQVAGGRLSLDLQKLTLPTTSAMADQCFDDVYVEASMRKQFKSRDPMPDYDVNEGTLFLTMTASGASSLTDAVPLTGYQASFFRQDFSPVGQVRLHYVKNFTHDWTTRPTDAEFRLLCGDDRSTVSLDGFEKIALLKKGSRLTMLFNGRKICSVDMAADATGARGTVRGAGVFYAQNPTSTITRNVAEIEYLRIEPR